MKTLTRILSLLICLTLTIPILPALPAFAKTYSGTCGDDLTWSLDMDTGILAISGTGKMTDYFSATTERYDTAPWYMYRINITSVIIESGVTSIGEFAFYDCYQLTNVTIPGSVTAIGQYAFEKCVNLSNITIPNGVKFIRASTFYGCTSLTNVTIPDSVTSIGELAFLGCTALTSITIPNSVKIIGYATFQDCTALTSVTIPDSVTSIAEWAFGNCVSLTSVTIPNSVTTIGESIFYGCTALASITVPDSVTIIEDDAFEGCNNLISITIPNSVTRIDRYAFSLCNSLTDVYYSGSEDDWSAIAIGNDNDCLTSATIHYNYNYYTDNFETDAVWNADPLSGLPDSIVLKCGGTSEFITLNQENVTLAIADESIAEIGGGLWTIPNEGVTEFSVKPKSQGTTILTATSQSGEVLTCKIEVRQIISVIINGNAVSFDQDSFMINGTSMVPLRGIFEMLGANVDWNEETKTATAAIEGRTISITVGSYEMTSYAPGIGTQTSILNVPAQLVDGYTMVPVRAVSEAFGADVSWDGDNFAVYINVPVEVCTVDTVPLGTLDGYEINYADFNGMYIDSFTHSTNSNGSEHVTFDVYNTTYIYGVVEVYNANSEIENIAIIQKMSDSTSIKGVLIDDTWEFIKDVTTGTALTYRQESGYSQKTSISVDIPAGGYIKITNDMMESFAACAINLTDIAFGLKKTLSSLSGFNDDTSIEYAGKLSLELVKSTVFSEIMKNPTKYSDELLKGVYKEFTINAETVGNFIGTVSSNLDNLADGKLTELAFTTAKSCAIGIAESTFENLSGPAGAALKAMFATSSIKNVLIEMKHGLDCMYQGSIKIINYKA